MYTLCSDPWGWVPLSLVGLLVYLLLNNVELLHYGIGLGLRSGLLCSELLEVVGIRPALEEVMSLDAAQSRMVPEMVTDIFAHHPMGLYRPPKGIEGV